jgi:hypothetical protein
MAEKPSTRVVSLIDRNPVDPSLEGALPPKTTDVAENLEKDFLNDIGGFRLVVQKSQSEGIYGLLKTTDQVFVGPFGSFTESFDQTEIIGFGARLGGPFRT